MKIKSVIAMLISLSLYACAPSVSNKKIDDLATRFKTSVHVDKQVIMLAPLIGASEGLALRTNNVKDSIEFYRFDTDIPAQKAALDKYQQDGAFFLIGEKRSVLVHGQFMLLVKPDYPNWQAIESTFNSF